MHTDPLFYRIFQERPATLFELAGIPYPPDAGYRLSAIEVKQTAFRLDGILAPTAEGTEAPVFFVEIQFQAWPEFYARWLAAIFLHFYRHGATRAWRAVVVYPDRATEKGLPRAYAPLAEAGLLHRVFLEDLLDLPTETFGIRLARLVVLRDAEAAAEARAMVATTMGTAQHFELLDLIETILVYKFPSLSRSEIRAMLNLPDTDLKQTRFYQEVFAEGREEGREEGETGFLLRLLTRRFGPLDPTLRERIAQLSSTQRGELTEAVFDFQTVADLHGWLRTQQPQPD
jgi:predicted transposase/invertase (TIGR01784 family)